MTAPTAGRAARGDALAELAELRAVGLDDEEQPRSPPALLLTAGASTSPSPPGNNVHRFKM
jgi:hypothetical protein